ncbi:MAG: zinc-ribbon domain-containing protein [Lachnospiraceae bacterium]|jgi:DNA-directed RNA polymerase subunit RPC12/RpoP|nr:zinc-ribbon domain-containing protein [Lachnospiraceae bacterium]
MKSYVAKWNRFDSIIFSLENRVEKLKAAIEDSSSEEPDVEAFIAAETEYLQHENEKLKEREIPVYLIENGTTVVCPKCNYQLPDAKVKYCSNCGHRVIEQKMKGWNTGCDRTKDGN